MSLAFRIYKGGIGHSIGSDGARRNAEQTGTRGATRTFTRDRDGRATAGGGLRGERGGVQDGIREAPVNQRNGRRSGQGTQLEGGGHVAAEGERIVTLRHFVIEELHSLNRKVLQEGRLQVPGEFLVEAFWVDVGVEGERCASPGVSEFTSGERKPPGGDGIEGDVSPVEADGLSFKEIRERFIGRGRIAQGARGQGEASEEIVIQTAIDAEADAKAGAIACNASGAILKDALPTQPDVATEAETSQDILQSAKSFVFVFGLLVHDRKRSLCFRGAGGGLVGQALGLGG